MVLELEEFRRRLQAAGYESGANIIGSVSQSLYKEGLIPRSLPEEGVIFESELVGDLVELDGVKVRELRKNTRYGGKRASQYALGERAELSHGYISQIEHNKVAVSEDAAVRLANALGVSLDEIRRQQVEETSISTEVPRFDPEEA